MNDQLREAYLDYLDDLARSGILDHALSNAILEGKTVEEHVVEVLRAAGRLPDGWSDALTGGGGLFPKTRLQMRPITEYRSEFSQLMSAQRRNDNRITHPPIVTDGWLRAG